MYPSTSNKLNHSDKDKDKATFMTVNMAGRRTCVLFLACGLLLSTAVSILIAMKTWQNRSYISVDQKLRAKSVSSTNRINLPRTVEAPGAKFNTSEVKRIREWVMTYFNPDTDLTVNKSQVKIGQLIRYEASRKEYANITENFFRLIPESSPLLGKHFRSCAVVGNSGILLGSHCGRQIDSADFVFRCNLAAIEGFEKDVGTKSNFTTMNPSVLNHDYKGYRENDSIRETFVKRLRLIGDQILHIPGFVSVNGRHDVEFTNSMILEHHLPIKVSYAPRDATGRMKA
ncbi:ST8SIA4 [Branchiostoma lanceolatum]|nr:ST8SIA4 [Branchiostoma lanceolatum]